LLKEAELPSQLVNLPGPITLVPSRTLVEKVARRARDHPGLPPNPSQWSADLNALRIDGAPATFDEPKRTDQDWSLLVHTHAYVMRLYPTQHGGGYTIADLSPRGMRDQHRVAQACLLVRPTGWGIAAEARQIPQGASNHWPQLVAAWRQLSAAAVSGKAVPAISPAHTAFLDRVDAIIDATERIAAAELTADRVFPYREVGATGEQRFGTRTIYEFTLAGGRKPDVGAFVQVRGEPEQRGRITRASGGSVTVNFDDPVAYDRLPPQGELEVTPSTVVFDKEREAVALLRSRQAHNHGLLEAIVDRRLRPIPPSSAQPTERLDEYQLDAFRRALTVEDMLLVLGPPGTGKTRIISQVADACAGNGERVLVTSHSNRAVDNVLGRLPRNLWVVRVGNDGKVTADGKPYLIEHLAADLREQLLIKVTRSLGAYENLEAAERWTEHFGNGLDALAAIAREEADARTALDAARRGVGGPAQARVDQLTAQVQQLEGAVARHRQRAERLSGRQQRALSRGSLPLLGRLFAAWARRLEGRRATELQAADNADTAGRQARSDLAAAVDALDATTADHPIVRQARTAWDDVVRRRDAARTEVLVGARTLREIVSPMAALPAVRDDGDAATTWQDLTTMRSWLDQHLPLFATRAKLLADWRDDASKETDQLYPELIRYADVIAATAIGAASRPELSGVDFDLAIVDEAGQIGIADVLVPLVRAKRGVLVGDHLQLPPFLANEVEAWGAQVGDPALPGLLAKSAFELLADGHPELLAAAFPDSHQLMLRCQRRMPAVIADFISAQFYGGRLRTEHASDFRDTLFENPFTFVDTSDLPPSKRYEQDGARRERWGQPGYTNDAEAELLTLLAAWYHRRSIEWAVIVPYRAQVAAIVDALTAEIGNAGLVELNVGTVDAFQGGERDVILFGFTRSNHHGNVGFLKELRRANVSFTRAKERLVLVGDMSTLTKARDQGFRHLALALGRHVRDRGEVRPYDDVHRHLAQVGTETR
jgi:hypothetical protein